MNEPVTQPKLSSQDFIMSQLNTSDMPNSLLDLPHVSKLNHLLIKNFKSFSKSSSYFQEE